MSDHNIRCPLCGMNRFKPIPHVPSTAWVDTCACNDQGWCLNHQVNWEERPDRPPEAVMEERARARAAQRLEDWERLRARFGAFTADKLAARLGPLDR